MQSEFIAVLHPDADLLESLEYNLLNSSVAAAGIYAAAFTIDSRWLGRQRMQVPSCNSNPACVATKGPACRGTCMMLLIALFKQVPYAASVFAESWALFKEHWPELTWSSCQYTVCCSRLLRCSMSDENIWQT